MRVTVTRWLVVGVRDNGKGHHSTVCEIINPAWQNVHYHIEGLKRDRYVVLEPEQIIREVDVPNE